MPRDRSQSLELLLDKKRALAEREQKLVDALNRVMAEMGHEVVRASSPMSTPTPRPKRRTAPQRNGSFRCPQCTRTFGQAMHLGRHVAALHRGKTARRKARTGARTER